ncbi:NAD(P)-binding protein [Streptomyces thermolilacinus]|uniref:NAD(P)-binding protein n=1 Tax=Streptomyces thermolilacinus TaxID=285540 RepID=UPI00040DCE47|nr:NAD(P)-binding protein [Streptomyces thermolilacinus]
MLNVLVSGGGIAGSALAHWLRRYGFAPTVVERAAAPRLGGQAVDVPGVALDVLDRMDLLGPPAPCARGCAACPCWTPKATRSTAAPSTPPAAGGSTATTSS